MDTVVLDAAVADAIVENIMIMLMTARDEQGQRRRVATLVAPAPMPGAAPDLPAMDMRPQIRQVEAALCGLVTALTGHPARIGSERTISREQLRWPR